MSVLTFTQMVGELGAWLDIGTASGSEGETTVKRCLNWGARRVWTARFWYERRSEVQAYTVAPYTTGTATFTNASTAVTGGSTVWTAAMTGRKIALSLGSPWYRFTRTGGTTGTIAPSSGYAEANATAVAYTIFQDEFDVATDCDVIYDAQLIRQEWGGGMIPLSEAAMDDSAFVHGYSSLPTHFTMTASQTTGTRRIRVFPIPDNAYRIRIRYWKSYTDMSDGADTCALGANKEVLVMKAAALYAQSLSDVRQITSEAEVSALIDQAWREQQDRVPVAYQKRGFDQVGASGDLWLDPTNAWS